MLSSSDESIRMQSVRILDSAKFTDDFDFEQEVFEYEPAVFLS